MRAKVKIPPQANHFARVTVCFFVRQQQQQQNEQHTKGECLIAATDV